MKKKYWHLALQLLSLHPVLFLVPLEQHSRNILHRLIGAARDVELAERAG